MPWVYILHLDPPYQHARHYSGCTLDLTQRLILHATAHNGKHAHFTHVLYLAGVEWRLGNLFQVKEDHHTIREAERILKDQKNAPRFCRLCSAHPKRIPGTETIPLAYTPISSSIEARAMLAQRKATAQDGSIKSARGTANVIHG